MCWPHAQNKQKTKGTKKKKNLSCNHRFQKKIRESETARWIRVVPREQQPQQNRGTRSSPLNRGLFEPNAARYHMTTTLAIFITQTTKTKNRKKKKKKQHVHCVVCPVNLFSFSWCKHLGGKDRGNNKQQPCDLGKQEKKGIELPKPYRDRRLKGKTKHTESFCFRTKTTANPHPKKNQMPKNHKRNR